MPAQYDKAPSQVKRNPFKNRSLFLSGGKHLLVGAGWKKQPLTPCYVVEMFVKKLPNLATSDDSFRKQRRPPSQPLIPLTQFSPAPAASPGNLNVRNSWAARRIHCHEMKCVTKPFHSWSMSGASATQSFVQGSWALSLFPSSARSTHQFNWLSPSSGAIVFLHDVAYICWRNTGSASQIHLQVVWLRCFCVPHIRPSIQFHPVCGSVQK